jgi:hypothetical protein
MELAQSRLVTDDVQRLARSYTGLVAVPVRLNEYYVEVPAGPVTVGFSRRSFTESERVDPAVQPARRPGEHVRVAQRVGEQRAAFVRGHQIEREVVRVGPAQ